MAFLKSTGAAAVLGLGLIGQGASAETCFHLDAGQYFDSLSYCVSSVLGAQSGNDYGPENLWDGDDRTAWCEGRPGTSGEYVALRVFNGPPFRRLVFRNGYAKSGRTFTRNARPRIVEITTDTGVNLRERLPDAPDEVIVMLPEPAQFEVMIRVVDVYPGSHYQDTCLNGVTIDFEWEELQLRN